MDNNKPRLTVDDRSWSGGSAGSNGAMNRGFGQGLFGDYGGLELDTGIPLDVQKIFSQDNSNILSNSSGSNGAGNETEASQSIAQSNQNDFMLSGFDDDQNIDSYQTLRTCIKTLEAMPLQLCPFCLKIVKDVPFKVVGMNRLKDTLFPVHQQCEEGYFKIKNEYEYVSTKYSFSTSMDSKQSSSAMKMGQSATSSWNQLPRSARPKLSRSHLIILEVQHAVSTATIFTIQQVTDLYQSPYQLNNDYVKLNLNASQQQLYQTDKYIVPIPIFSIRTNLINLEDKRSFMLDMLVNLSQFEAGTELELKGRKEDIAELKICGIVVSKQQIKQIMSSSQSNYEIPANWFMQGSGNKGFQVVSIEFDFIDPAIQKVRKTIQDSFQNLNESTQLQYTPPLSHGSVSPSYRSPRELSPLTGDASGSPPSEQLTYDSIRGQIAMKVQKNKEWSMAIQTLLRKSAEAGDFDDIQTVIEEIRPKLGELMKHHYGNYFSKTLLQVCSMHQKYLIISEIQEQFCEISCDPQGTHAIQALVEIIRIENQREQVLIMQSIEEQIIMLSMNVYGTHVMNKIVLNFSIQNITPVFEAILKSFREVVRNKQGVCIIKSLMSKCLEVSSKKNMVLKLLKEDLREITIDKYGNYALQEAIKIYSDDETSFISDFVYEEMVSLAQNQVSSNIVESILQYSKKNRNRYIAKIMNNLGQLVNDAFGKFVVKRVLNLVEVDKTQIAQFRQLLNQHLATNPKQAAFYTTQKMTQLSPKTRPQRNQQQQQ